MYGFEFSFTVPRDGDALRNEFVRIAEGQGLSVSGGADGRYVISRDGAQATDQDRQLLLEWASARGDIIDAVAGPLIDLKGE
jgi:hypothetical protein